MGVITRDVATLSYSALPLAKPRGPRPVAGDVEELAVVDNASYRIGKTMHELNKIKEAEYFYARMAETREKRDEFRYNLSAFLAAARSVLQYALREAHGKPGGQTWYDRQVAGNRVVAFFKDRRDIEIHEKPVPIRADIGISLSETVDISESVAVVLKDGDGNIIQSSRTEPQAPTSPCPSSSVLSLIYKFGDWTGEEDVLQLCDAYLNELRNIVADGRSKGFLS